MHLNYRQFLHYNNAALDNILLITPNEGLSEQHLQELALSDIPAKRFVLNESGLLLPRRNTVRVLEITKLAQEKRGRGERVPVEAFSGNNLIFVDEGHKGSGGAAWLKLRNALGATGFTFEYSATFGQALTAARNDPLTIEYGKAIVFDYSYRYFYGDGYGKDFRILNLAEETTEGENQPAAARQPVIFLPAKTVVYRTSTSLASLQPGASAMGICRQYGECGLYEGQTGAQRRTGRRPFPASGSGQ